MCSEERRWERLGTDPRVSHIILEETLPSEEGSGVSLGEKNRTGGHEDADSGISTCDIYMKLKFCVHVTDTQLRSLMCTPSVAAFVLQPCH